MPGVQSRTDKTDASAEAPAPPRGLWRRYVWTGGPRSKSIRVGALVLLGCAAGAGIAPWTVSRGALREEIAAQLRSSSGLFVFTSGRSTFSLLPQPRIQLENISFVDPRGAMVIEADRLDGQVSLLPLLAGRLELAGAALHRPRLTIDIDGRPMTAAGAIVRAADARPSTPEAAKADRARLGIVSFVDGAASLRRAGAVVDTLERIDATLDWRTVSSPASLTGDATWRGQRASVSFWIARPSDLLRGERSPLTLQINAPALTLSANGAAASGARPQFDGRLVASTNSLRHLVGVFGGAVPLPLTMGPASIDGKAEASPTALNLAGLKLRLDGAEYQGALSWRADEGRPLLSGTLAAETLDVAEALRYLPAFIGPDRHFSRDPIAWRDANAFDIDLRVSAAKANFDRTPMQDVAGALLLKNGRLEASLADARIYKGAVKARLSLTPAEQGRVDLKASVQARGMDWSAFGWDRFGDAHVAGLANLHLSLEGGGTSIDQIARSVVGHGDIDIANGDIVGLDVERVLKRIEKRPLASAGDIRSGRTAFDRARLSATIAEGVATFADGAVEGDSYSMVLSGAAQLAERQLGLRAVVSPKDSKGLPKAEAPGFAFDVTGAWDAPAIVPDARSLIRRSGAAQPLFAPRQDKPAE